MEIDPIWVILFDQRNLPCPRPSLQPFFAMDRLFDLFEDFEIDQSTYLIFLGETTGDFQLMFTDAANEIVSYTNIERATDAAGENVDVELASSHRPPLEYWVARSSRAMTSFDDDLVVVDLLPAAVESLLPR